MKVEWASLGWAVVGGLGVAFVMSLSTAATYGRLETKVDALIDRVGKAEDRLAKAERPKVAKGDLCLELISGLENSSDFERRSAEIAKQLKNLDCYEAVAAASMVENTAQ